MPLIFDIETTSWFKDKQHESLTLTERQDRRLRDEEKIKANHVEIITQAALSPFTGQITVIGTYDPKGDYLVYTNGYDDQFDPLILDCKNEKALLEKFWSVADKYLSNGDRIVSFAGKSFDLPYIFVRSLINNVSNTADYLNLIHPYSHDLHMDIKSFFNKGSLEEISYVFDFQTDNETDGSELPELWKTKPDEVIEKCKSDLIKTAKLYERIKEWIPQRLQMYSSSKTDIIT